MNVILLWRSATQLTPVFSVSFGNVVAIAKLRKSGLGDSWLNTYFSLDVPVHLLCGSDLTQSPESSLSESQRSTSSAFSPPQRLAKPSPHIESMYPCRSSTSFG
eukprot:scaffold37564_cov33-Cyclotella_meneghiniana.AAC.1